MSSIPDTIKVKAAGAEDVGFIQHAMDAYDAEMLPPENIRDLNFAVRNEKDEIIGGILANTRYSTVYINTIWVDERYRRRGIGRKLIERVEREARKMGCVYSALGSWESFNTRHFYESLGYVIVSVSLDSPQGQVGYWFNKKLREK